MMFKEVLLAKFMFPLSQISKQIKCTQFAELGLSLDHRFEDAKSKSMIKQGKRRALCHYVG
jgi:hypothetical protein